MAQTLEIEDFSGGVTDYYLNAPPNKMRYCDNLLLIRYPGLAKPVTRPGSEVYDVDHAQLPSGEQRVSASLYFRGFLLTQSASDLYYYAAAGWQGMLGPVTTNDAFIGATTSTVVTYGQNQSHLLFAHSGRGYPQKAYISSSTNIPKVREAGLPKISSSTIVTANTAGAGSETYLYKFVYRIDYTDTDGIVWTDYGSPSDAITKGSASIAGGVSISVIPTLANSTTNNWDTSTTLKIEIYRTVDDGTVFYRVGSVNNATTVYADTTIDATLTANQLLYTEGGVVANDRPPRCKLVHIFDDTGYYANIKDSTNQVITNRCQQSVPGDFDACPEDFYVDVDDEIVGMSSTKSNLVLLCSGSAYRVDGIYDQVGRGGMVAEKISDTAGCVSAQSVVQTLQGIFWAGVDGIYFTDGFQVVKLNGDYDKTYKEFIVDSNGEIDTTKTARIQGKYDKRQNRIWWTVQHTSTDDVDKCYVLDLNWGVKENATFTTITGDESFSPTAIEFDSLGRMVRCDRRGYVLIHRDTLYVDPKIDTTAAAEDWISLTIFWDLETIAYNFGTAHTRKLVTMMSMTAEALTNLSLQITTINDDGSSEQLLSPIRYRGAIVWGEDDLYWGDPTIVWGQVGLLSEKRRMPAGGLRCNYRQLKFTNAIVVIVSSDLLGTCVIDSTLKTATLTNAATLDWPTQSIDYYIAFEADSYVRNYLITARTADALTYSDAINASATAAASKWVIRGYPKGEIFNLLSYAIPFQLLGQSQHAFQTGESGEVGS